MKKIWKKFSDQDYNVVILMNCNKILQVLVVAPQYPVVNQSWIENYLQQLYNNSIDFFIYTTKRKVKNESRIKEITRFWNKVSLFNLKYSSIVCTLLKNLVFDMKLFFRVVRQAKKISIYLHEKYSLDAIKPFVLMLYFGLSKEKSLNVDIVHSHSEASAYYFMLMALIRRKPLIYTFHGLLPQGVSSLSLKKRQALYNEVDRVLVNTKFARRQVVDRGCPEDKVCVVPQGLPLDNFPFQPLPYPRKNEKLRVFTVGRLHRDKGHGYALLAMTRLIRAGINLQYTIVGVGPERNRLRDCINRLGIASYTEIHEGISFNKLLEKYKDSHIFLLPSINNNLGIHVETQGVVLQEAQAVGCIPIATNVGGIPECLNHLHDSIIVNDKSSRSICNAIYYLNNNPDLWTNLQKNGRRNVEKRYSSDIIGDEIASVLRNTVQNYEYHAIN
jgi:glycosyltransferase involved in cell wall biosynthesis